MKPALRRRLFVASILAVLALLTWLRPGVAHSPWTMIRLFHPDVRVENFQYFEHVFPARAVPASTQPHVFASRAQPLPAQYNFAGDTRNVADFIARSQTTGLLVLHNGVMVHEEYHQGATATSRHTSWSLAKSFVAALVGIALQDGKIHSLDDHVVDYVPDYAGTAWADVTIRDLLRMASGIAFDERYDAHFSDIQRVFHRTFLFGMRIDDAVRDYPRAAPPGTRFDYVSINTQVLANVLRHATGKPLDAYAAEKLWQPLGMQDEALWSVDIDNDSGTEIAYCCLNTTLRDYAKLGQLYLRQGRWNGVQILPPGWVAESTRRTEPWLAPGSTFPGRGYGYHWWVPAEADGEYFANGIWGQAIWVDERRNVVIVKTSVDPDFEANIGEMIAFMRGIAANLGTSSAIPLPGRP